MRIAVGGPDENPFTALVLDNADEQYRIEVDKQLDGSGTARVWIPAERALVDVWQPSADLSGVRDLPVLVVIGAAEIDAVIDDLADAIDRGRRSPPTPRSPASRPSTTTPSRW